MPSNERHREEAPPVEQSALEKGRQHIVATVVNQAIVLWAMQGVDAASSVRRQMAEYRRLKEQQVAATSSGSSVEERLAVELKAARPAVKCPTPASVLEIVCSSANKQDAFLVGLHREEAERGYQSCDQLLRTNHQYIFGLLPSSVTEGCVAYADALLQEYDTVCKGEHEEGGATPNSQSTYNTKVPHPYESAFAAASDRIKRGVERCLRYCSRSLDPVTGRPTDRRRPRNPQAARRRQEHFVIDDDEEEGVPSRQPRAGPPPPPSAKNRTLQPLTKYSFSNAMSVACSAPLGIGNTAPKAAVTAPSQQQPNPQLEAEVVAEILVLHELSCSQRLSSGGSAAPAEVLAHVNRSFGSLRSVTASGLPPSVRGYVYGELLGIPILCSGVGVKEATPTDLPPPDELLRGLRIGTPTLVRAKDAASTSGVTTRMGSGWLGVVPTRIQQRLVPDERTCGGSGSLMGVIRRSVVSAVFSFTGHDDRYFVVLDEALLLVCSLLEDEGVQLRMGRSCRRAILSTGTHCGPGSEADTNDALGAIEERARATASPYVLPSVCAHLASPLAYLTTDAAGGYMLLRSMYLQLWAPLTQPSLELVTALGVAEALVMAEATRNSKRVRDTGSCPGAHGFFDLRVLMHCFRSLRLAPLSLMTEWICTGFVNVLRPHQVLELWDRVLALHNFHVHTEREVRGLATVSEATDDSHMWNSVLGGGGGRWACGAAKLPVVSPAYLFLACTAAALFLHRGGLLATATCRAEALVLFHTFPSMDVVTLLNDFLRVNPVS